MTTFKELEIAVNNYNKNISRRFAYNKGTQEILIGSYTNPYKFSKDNYEDAYNFIEKYGMLKEDKDCLGEELYYKGLKWDNLTKNQRDSVLAPAIEYVLSHKNVSMAPPEEYGNIFENNLSFIVF